MVNYYDIVNLASKWDKNQYEPFEANQLLNDMFIIVIELWKQNDNNEILDLIKFINHLLTKGDDAVVDAVNDGFLEFFSPEFPKVIELLMENLVPHGQELLKESLKQFNWSEKGENNMI